jgi:hypothetical protein
MHNTDQRRSDRGCKLFEVNNYLLEDSSFRVDFQDCPVWFCQGLSLSEVRRDGGVEKVKYLIDQKILTKHAF